MFGLGFLEIGLIVLLAVMLFPPTELPKLARSLARAYGSVRRIADEFRATVLEDQDIGEPIREIRTAYQETRFQLRRAEEAARRDIARTQAQVKSLSDTKPKDAGAAQEDPANDDTGADAAAKPAGTVAVAPASAEVEATQVAATTASVETPPPSQASASTPAQVTGAVDSDASAGQGAA